MERFKTEFFSLSRALEICSQYLLLRTVILQKKVFGCPSCKCYFLEFFRFLIIQFFFIKTYFSRQFLSLNRSEWMNENKHEGRRELPPAKSQTWTDWRRETVNHKPQFAVCSKCQTSVLRSVFLIFDSLRASSPIWASELPLLIISQD